MSDSPVLARDAGAARVITINRPGKRNALNLETKALLAQELERAFAFLTPPVWPRARCSSRKAKQRA